MSSPPQRIRSQRRRHYRRGRRRCRRRLACVGAEAAIENVVVEAADEGVISAQPYQRIVPASPLSGLATLLPVMALNRALPIPLRANAPVRVRFSTLTLPGVVRFKLTELWIVSSRRRGVRSRRQARCQRRRCRCRPRPACCRYRPAVKKVVAEATDEGVISAQPASVSLPARPFMMLATLVPIMTLFRSLPVSWRPCQSG